MKNIQNLIRGIYIPIVFKLVAAVFLGVNSALCLASADNQRQFFEAHEEAMGAHFAIFLKEWGINPAEMDLNTALQQLKEPNKLSKAILISRLYSQNPKDHFCKYANNILIDMIAQRFYEQSEDPSLDPSAVYLAHCSLEQLRESGLLSPFILNNLNTREKAKAQSKERSWWPKVD